MLLVLFRTLANSLISLISLTFLIAATCQAQILPNSIESNPRLLIVEDSLVSIFENSTLIIQYEFIGDIKDGNGFTAGRAGFTSRTGDMLEVLLEYERLSPNNTLRPYIKPLRSVYGSPNTIPIKGLKEDWSRLAKEDQLFRKAQDNVNDRLYRKPAHQLARDLGLILPISYVALYEAGIQHGFGDTYDSLPTIVDRANKKAGGTPKKGINELDWLKTFIAAREDDLRNPKNLDYKELFQYALDRPKAIRTIIDQENENLNKQISVKVYGDVFTF